MYYFIVNPSAGSGRGRRVWKAIACYMDLHNIEYEAVLTGSVGDARIAARELTEKKRQPGLLIVVGGSGTVNEVLDGAVLHGILIWVIFRQAREMIYPAVSTFPNVPYAV